MVTVMMIIGCAVPVTLSVSLSGSSSSSQPKPGRAREEPLPKSDSCGCRYGAAAVHRSGHGASLLTWPGSSCRIRAARASGCVITTSWPAASSRIGQRYRRALARANSRVGSMGWVHAMYMPGSAAPGGPWQAPDRRRVSHADRPEKQQRGVSGLASNSHAVSYVATAVRDLGLGI